jgi:hypothetical protein
VAAADRDSSVVALLRPDRARRPIGLPYDEIANRERRTGWKS